MKIEVKVVVCDWGVFINDELSKDLIFNSKEIAKEVKRIMELDNAHISVDRSTTAINITKSEEYMLNQFRKIPYIDVGIVDYSGAVPQVLISNENRIVDAYLNLGLVEVTDENQNSGKQDYNVRKG